MIEYERTCKICGADEEETTLKRCIMCHKYFCEKCKYVKSGRNFCSRECGDYFFFDESREQ